MTHPTKQQCGINFEVDGETFVCSLASGHAGGHGRIDMLTSKKETCACPTCGAKYYGNLEAQSLELRKEVVRKALGEIERFFGLTPSAPETSAHRCAYRDIAGCALNGTDEADELAKLPPLERERETYRRTQERGLALLTAGASEGRRSLEEIASYATTGTELSHELLCDANAFKTWCASLLRIDLLKGKVVTLKLARSNSEPIGLCASFPLETSAPLTPAEMGTVARMAAVSAQVQPEKASAPLCPWCGGDHVGADCKSEKSNAIT